ncbi:hypothetical protein LguiA_014705 [Lonicera macranthoides]
MARIEALEAARVAEAEAHRVEKEAMLAREAKFDKLFDMLSASGLLPPNIFTSSGHSMMSPKYSIGCLLG